MSTTLQRTRGEPLAHGHTATEQVWQWVKTYPGLSCLVMSLVYVATIAALVAVVQAEALGTAVGAGVVVLFAAQVIGYFAMAVYIFTPEKPSD